MTKQFFITFLFCLLLTACRKSEAGTKTVNTLYDTSTTEVTRSKVTEYELPAPLNDRPEQILRRTGYTTSYNKETRCPNWVAWHLTKAHTYGRHQRKEELFTEDTDVEPRATDADYYNSRYDRGHMCPAGDNKWDATAMRESFLFTNICPQNHYLNKYEWNALENLCRDWARRYGAIDIVCGPLYTSSTPKTIGRGHVRVPDGFFKVIMCRTGQAKAIGFIFKNDGRKVALDDVVCTVDEVEQATGIDFYPALDDRLENRIEASARLNEWQ
jgi:endonuclease G